MHRLKKLSLDNAFVLIDGSTPAVLMHRLKKLSLDNAFVLIDG
jgi:hypothetical protein